MQDRTFGVHYIASNNLLNYIWKYTTDCHHALIQPTKCEGEEFRYFIHKARTLDFHLNYPCWCLMLYLCFTWILDWTGDNMKVKFASHCLFKYFGIKIVEVMKVIYNFVYNLLSFILLIFFILCCTLKCLWSEK